jgi:hypothetical protein
LTLPTKEEFPVPKDGKLAGDWCGTPQRNVDLEPGRDFESGGEFEREGVILVPNCIQRDINVSTRFAAGKRPVDIGKDDVIVGHKGIP